MKKTKKQNRKIKKSNLFTLILFIVLIVLIIVYFRLPNKEEENIKMDDIGKSVYEELMDEYFERNAYRKEYDTENKNEPVEEILEFINQDELLKVTKN